MGTKKGTTAGMRSDIRELKNIKLLKEEITHLVFSLQNLSNRMYRLVWPCLFACFQDLD